MRWINKRESQTRKKAHHIVSKFIRSCWDEDTHQYINCNYDEFKKKKKFIFLLNREQNYRCCYCMRNLYLEGADKNDTLEHVMPRNVKKKDIGHYYKCIDFFRRSVSVNTFKKDKKWRGYKFPHFCAYENLTLSCNGSLYQTENPKAEIRSKLHYTCNNPRKDEKIEPLFFYRGIEKQFGYDNDGLILCNPRYESTLKTLHLENETLVLIRKGWAHIATKYSTSDVLKAKKNKKLRQDMVDIMQMSYKEEQKMMNDLYWHLFSQFSWFDQYFKCK